MLVSKMEDSQGLSVTCTDLSALEAINLFIDADLHYKSPSFATLQQAITQAPDTPMLYCYAGVMQLYSDSREAQGLAQRLIEPIGVGRKNQRETMWLSALQAWINGDFGLVIKRLLGLVSAYPRDLVAARLGIVHCLMSGDHPHMLDFAQLILSIKEHVHHAAALSFVSFAYLENDDLETAERYVRIALKLNPHLAWAQHNLAHIYATRDQFSEGLAALQGNENDWEGLFIRAHCYWHKAIFHILLGQLDRAVEIYRDVLLPMNWWHVVSLVNLLSLLMYVDLFGGDVRPLVTETLVARLKCRERWGIDRLVDLLTVWTLAKVGDGETARALAQSNQTRYGDIWHIGCSAMFLLSLGDRQGAGRLITPLQLLSFGGSNEQRKALTDACLVTRAITNSA